MMAPVEPSSELAATSPRELSSVPAPEELPPDRSLGPAERVIPSWTDPTVARASDLIGGPMGRHASVGRNRVLTPLRVCLLFAIMILLAGWLFKSPCIQQGPGGHLDQSGQRPWISGCYNDIVPLFGGRKLDIGAFPFKASWTEGNNTRYMEYPVLSALWMYAMSGISHGYTYLVGETGLAPKPMDVAAYFTVTAIALSLMFLWAVAMTARMTRKRIWDTALMCLAPILVVHGFTNWDLLAMALLAAAMYFWSRSRPYTSGVFIGLGMAAKLYPVFLLGPLLVLAIRTRKWAGLVKATVAGALAWAAVNVPIMVLYPRGWQEFIRLNSERPPEFTTWYTMFQKFTGWNVWDKAPGASAPDLLNNLSLALFLAACAGIAWLGLSVARRPRLAQLMFLVIAAFLLTNKVWSPQYSLWLLPLVPLAVPRWRPVLLWQGIEWCVWMLLMWYFAGEANKGISDYPYLWAAVARDAIILFLCALIVRDMLRPERDPVRMTGDDDPVGGIFENAPDRLTLPSVGALLRGRRRRGISESADPAGVCESADAVGVCESADAFGVCGTPDNPRV